jgi:hypothetical protein
MQVIPTSSMKSILLTLIAFSLSACVAQIPFRTVTYESGPVRSTGKSASISHNEIDVAKTNSLLLVPIGVVFVPINTSPTDQHQFNKGHQAEFAELLRTELERLKLFRHVAPYSSATQSDIAIKLEYKTIVRGAHNSFAMALRLGITGGKDAFSKEYFVVSDDGDSLGDKLTTNASEGKVKLVRKLLQLLIPEIRAYAESDA